MIVRIFAMSSRVATLSRRVSMRASRSPYPEPLFPPPLAGRSVGAPIRGTSFGRPVTIYSKHSISATAQRRSGRSNRQPGRQPLFAPAPHPRQVPRTHRMPWPKEYQRPTSHLRYGSGRLEMPLEACCRLSARRRCIGSLSQSCRLPPTTRHARFHRTAPVVPATILHRVARSGAMNSRLSRHSMTTSGAGSAIAGALMPRALTPAPPWSTARCGGRAWRRGGACCRSGRPATPCGRWCRLRSSPR